jgi:AcrR family transcriptional regulator
MAEVELTRRERRRLQIRERILEKALDLFQTQGYEATTVAEIVPRADIAYGTFFNHFPSKLHLLREISNRSLQDLFKDVEEVRKGPGSCAEHLVALFESSARRAEDKGPRVRDLINAMSALTVPETAERDGRRIRLAFRAVLEDGLAAGEIRDGVDLDTLTEVVVGTWYSMFLSWVHFDGYPLRERAACVARFLAETLVRPQPPVGPRAPLEERDS